MEWKYVTDIGKIRDLNEDYVLLDSSSEEAGLLGIVCDGLGGCLAGEVASEEAAETMRKAFMELRRDAGDDIRQCMVRAVQQANQRIWRLSASVDEYSGMGTTLTTVWTDGIRAWFSSVGDSRGYIQRGGELTQITEDQSYVWELYRQGSISKDQMFNHPMNHLISMAVGMKPELSDQDIGLYRRDLQEGDVIILCSDGLTDVIPEADIQRIIASGSSLETVCSDLVREGNRISGKDNITILLIRI